MDHLIWFSVFSVECPQVIPIVLRKFPNLKVLEVHLIHSHPELVQQSEVFAREAGKSFSYKMQNDYHYFMFSTDAGQLLKAQKDLSAPASSMRLNYLL